MRNIVCGVYIGVPSLLEITMYRGQNSASGSLGLLQERLVSQHPTGVRVGFLVGFRVLGVLVLVLGFRV